MNNMLFALLIVVALLVFYLFCYTPPHENLKVGAPYGHYLKETQENPLDIDSSEKFVTRNGNKTVNQLDWATMSRGLNIPIPDGQSQAIDLLSRMEKSSAFDITTDNRSLD